MKGRTARNLTRGSISRHVAALAIPAILSTLVHNLYGLNDIFFSKFVGPEGQTAVSNNLFTMIAIFGVIQLAAVGTLTLVARRTGAGNHEGADRAARQGILFAAALGVATAVPGLIFGTEIGRLMGMKGEFAEASSQYLSVLFLGLPALFFFPTIEAIFRARGDARTPLFLQIVAVGTNIAGNAIAVFVLDAGVVGLACATILSRLTGAGLGLWLLSRGTIGLELKRRSGPFFDLALWAKTALVSAPVGARTLLFGVIYQVISRIASDFGPDVQNGLGVGIRIEGLCFFVMIGFGIAASPIVGQNLGAGQPARAARGAWTTVGMAMVPALFFTGFFYFAPDFLMDTFAANEGTAFHGVNYLRIVSIAMVFLALEVILAQSFVGAGETLPPMLIDVPLTAARIPLSIWLARDLGWGPEGIWWAISGTAVARGVCMALWFQRGGWKRARPDLD